MLLLQRQGLFLLLGLVDRAMAALGTGKVRVGLRGAAHAVPLVQSRVSVAATAAIGRSVCGCATAAVLKVLDLLVET